MPHLDLPGASLYYETDGHITSPAVLLLHAGIASLRMWDPLVPRLAGDHFVIRFDERGFGQTKTENTEFSDRQDARDLLDHLGIDQAVVVGSSRGGSIALDLAVETPARVTGVMTIGSGPSGFPEAELTEAETAAFETIDSLFTAGEWHQLMRAETEIWAFGPTRRASELDPAFVEVAYEVHRPNAAHWSEEPVDLELDPPAYGRVAGITVPVLATVGDLDVSVCLDQQVFLVESIPNAEGYIFADSAHLPSLEHQDEFAAVLTGWMRRNGL
jgi:3-oxoadipate enol-lactonase